MGSFGALTALAFLLVLGDASRFRSSRMVGPYLGLTPGRDQSGQSDPQKGISKEGDRLMRRLLIQSGHYILGPFGSTAIFVVTVRPLLDEEGRTPENEPRSPWHASSRFFFITSG